MEVFLSNLQPDAARRRIGQRGQGRARKRDRSMGGWGIYEAEKPAFGEAAASGTGSPGGKAKRLGRLAIEVDGRAVR